MPMYHLNNTTTNQLLNLENRMQIVEYLLKTFDSHNVAEIGVLRGELAEYILKNCYDQIDQYLMIDPWQNLSSWNKPANKDDAKFEEIYQEALKRTSFAQDKISVIRKTTKDAAKEINNVSLDAAYIDGDHTLRGITIDLHSTLPKLKKGGIILGDDCTTNIWQHGTKYDPTLVYPYIIYFAEAYDIPVYTLPRNQFLMINDPGMGFSFNDITGSYKGTENRKIFLPDFLNSYDLKKTLKKILRKIRSQS